eukprot:4501517-Pleurochrysis_carterae.AAC.2
MSSLHALARSRTLSHALSLQPPFPHSPTPTLPRTLPLPLSPLALAHPHLPSDAADRRGQGARAPCGDAYVPVGRFRGGGETAAREAAKRALAAAR